MLGRAKSCRWQVFVRRRPPKQGELRTDVSKATMFQGDGEALRPTIQIAGRYVFEAKVTGIHQVPGYAENYIFPGIAGNALNRCDAPALQHKMRANSKRTAVFFANSRLRAVGRGGGGWKRVALDSNKERFVRIKVFLHIKRRLLRTVKNCSNERCFGCENERFLRAKRKAFCKWKTFGLRKRQTFSAHAKQPDKEKLFLSAPQQPLPTAPKLTCSNPF